LPAIFLEKLAFFFFGGSGDAQSVSVPSSLPKDEPPGL